MKKRHSWSLFLLGILLIGIVMSIYPTVLIKTDEKSVAQLLLDYKYVEDNEVLIVNSSKPVDNGSSALLAQ